MRETLLFLALISVLNVISGQRWTPRDYESRCSDNAAFDFLLQEAGAEVAVTIAATVSDNISTSIVVTPFFREEFTEPKRADRDTSANADNGDWFARNATPTS